MGLYLTYSSAGQIRKKQQDFEKLVIIIQQEDLHMELEKEVTGNLQDIFEPFIRDLMEFLETESHLKLENPNAFCEALSQILLNSEIFFLVALNSLHEKYKDILQEMLFSFGKSFIKKSQTKFFGSVMRKNSLYLVKNLFETVFEYKNIILQNFKINEELNLLDFVVYLIKDLIQFIENKLNTKTHSNSVFVIQLEYYQLTF